MYIKNNYLRLGLLKLKQCVRKIAAIYIEAIVCISNDLHCCRSSAIIGIARVGSQFVDQALILIICRGVEMDASGGKQQHSHYHDEAKHETSKSFLNVLP